MTNAGTPKLEASRAAPLINKSAPTTNKTKPTINITQVMASSNKK
jgi:hypothetical protein